MITSPAAAWILENCVGRRNPLLAQDRAEVREEAPPVAAHPDAAAERRPSPELQARVQEDAAAELENLKPSILANCWNGAAGLPSTATFTYSLIFDAEGQEIERGSRDAPDVPAEIAECIRSQAGALNVRAPGRELEVTVALTLP